MHNVNLIWFRNDLRTLDNPALYFACKNNTLKIILALFISTPKQWKQNVISPRKISLIYENIIYLQKKLNQLGIHFFYHESSDYLDSINYIFSFCHVHHVTSIFFNCEYGFLEYKRDKIVKQKLKRKNISINTFHDSTLIEPDIIKSKKNTVYKSYSHFKKKYILELKKNIPKCFSIPIKNNFENHSNLLFKIPKFSINFDDFDHDLFPIGEDSVLNVLKLFLKNNFSIYSHDNNLLNMNVTSLLSPHLSIGVISSRQCINLLLKKYPNVINSLDTCSWINELIWREFYKYLLYFYPDFYQKNNIYSWEHKIKWNQNSYHFKLWKQGQTGYPIVDAGIKQLRQLGWINNRLRMILASFLVKNLLIHWKQGERYFMSKLIDGDYASNNGNWRWMSSIDMDHVPYFRIFNPMLQSKKFDKHAKYIRKYIPELKNTSISDIHNPCNLNKIKKICFKYPMPMVNYYHSRNNTLLVLKRAKYELNK